MTRPSILRGGVATGALAAALLCLSPAAQAQSLAVNPINVLMAPGQMATLLTVINQGQAETAVQIRAFVWSQKDGIDVLTPSDDVVASPPLTRIVPGGTQIVRLVLRKPVIGREATYRILLDQIPAAAEAGVVRVALRMSLPVFAQPTTRVAPKVSFHIERDATGSYLVALNDGAHHDAIRDLTLSTANGTALKLEDAQLPYILAGATRRWHIAPDAALASATGPFMLTASTETGVLKRLPVAFRP
ncbi:fimbrial biogenesis chaperone [Sphingomonas glacialis]|nr:fimbria/pilus periplasmic chaperone [Sphingomonas glacialis]